jgi:hypothetical protein
MDRLAAPNPDKKFTAGAPVCPDLFRTPTPTPASMLPMLPSVVFASAVCSAVCPRAGPGITRLIYLLPSLHTVFEWRQHVQHKLRNVEDELSALRRSP